MKDAANLRYRVRCTMSEYREVQEVDVIIDGKPYRWNESQVRAFQIIANRASDQEFEEFQKRVKIASGPDRHERMIMRRDGKFENEFEGGFLDGNAKMAFEIL